MAPDRHPKRRPLDLKRARLTRPVGQGDATGPAFLLPLAGWMGQVVTRMASPEYRQTPKLGGLDSLRGIGAVLVVVHHLMLAFHPWAILGEPHPTNASWESALHRFPLSLLVAGRFAVHVFFVLSGVVLSLGFFGDRARSDAQLAAAAFKRTFRLAPMVLAGVALVLLASAMGWVSSGPAAKLSGSEWLATKPFGSMELGAIARGIGLNLFIKSREYNSPLWTIGTELYGSFLVFFLLLVLRKLSWRWIAYAAVVAWLRSDERLPFVAGLILADLHRSTSWFREWCSRLWILVPSVLVVGILGAFPLGLDDAHRNAWIPGGVALARFGSWNHFAGAILLVAIVLGNPLVDRILSCGPGRYLGRISYALYATHEVVILTFCSALYLRWHPSVGGGIAGCLAALGGVPLLLLLAELGTRAVDRPSLRLADWVAGRFLRSWQHADQPSKASI